MKGLAVGTLTVTVPNNTPVLGVQLARGSLNVDGYHNGTLIAHMRDGNVGLHNMSGDVFVQDLRGTLQVSDSTFGRLRARGALGPMVFERCNVRQIEATNVNGSIVYDRGTFEPGLARFAAIRWTSDGVPVALHDATVNRTTSEQQPSTPITVSGERRFFSLRVPSAE